MGGQSNGYQSQPMQSWGGGYGGGMQRGGAGGYGNGGYQPGMNGQYGGIQGGGGGQGGGGSFSGGNMAWRDPNSPLYNWDQTHAGGQQGGFGQQSSQNYGGNQYGNPFSQFMQQWPQFGQQYTGGQQLYGNPGGMGVMGGNMINPNGVGDPSQNYRQQIRLQAGPQYETTGIVPPGGMTQNNGQLDYATQQQPFGGGF